MSVLLLPPIFQFFDDNGDPVSNGSVDVFAAGTTTRQATYTDYTGLTLAPNPIQLNAAGRPTSGGGAIWGEGSYKFIVRDSNGVQVGQVLDNVTSFAGLVTATNSYAQLFSGNGVQTVFTTSADLGVDPKAILVSVASGLPEIAQNGSFTTDTLWTKGAGWTIGSGVATATGAISTAISQVPVLTVIPGQAYAVTYTITRSAGGLIPSIGGQNGIERTASGTYREIIIAAASTPIAFTGNAFTGTLDSVSVTAATSQQMALLPTSSYTINGTTLTFSTAPALGVNNIDVRAPSLLVGSASTAANLAQIYAANALTSQTAAATSEANALIYKNQAEAAALSLSGTSTTSLAIGTGTKVFTTQAGKAFNEGAWLLITSDANEANYMHGQVTTYSSTTLTMNITNIGGSGTFADWTIRVAGTRGATGSPGPAIPIANAGGTVNAITADYTPDLVVNDGTVCIVIAAGANTTTTPTFSPDGATARTIVKKGGAALVAGDISAAGHACFLEYNLANTRWELLNPAKVVAVDINSGAATNGQVLTANGSGGASFLSPAGGGSVRQTVLSGPVDSAGLAAFGGSIGSTTVTASGTLSISAASGATDVTGSIANPSWTGLSTNGTMYLYLDITGGSVTTGSTTLAPVYQWGGTSSVTNNQHTFNIQEMTMRVGNGSVATATTRVFVGQVTVASGAVTAIVWYALMGRYVSAESSLPAVGSSLTLAHNIGAGLERFLMGRCLLVCTTADGNYSVGDVVTQYTETPSAGNFAGADGVRFRGLNVTRVAGAIDSRTIDNSTGGTAIVTRASWRYVFQVYRIF